jgi:hypothetical protein
MLQFHLCCSSTNAYEHEASCLIVDDLVGNSLNKNCPDLHLNAIDDFHASLIDKLPKIISMITCISVFFCFFFFKINGGQYN